MKVTPKPREYQAVFYNGNNHDEVCAIYGREYAGRYDHDALMGLTRLWVDGEHDAIWVENDCWYVEVDYAVHVYTEEEFFDMYEVL